MRYLLITLFMGYLCAFAQADVGKVTTGNTLQIVIKGVPAEEQTLINGNYHVGKSGTIKLPITGKIIRVAGLTNEQVERSIESSYKKAQIYKEPVIEIIIAGQDQPEARTLSVGGMVKRPGPIKWKRGLTLLQAIQAAGDRNAFGSKTIYLTRKGVKYTLSLGKIQHQNTQVLPDDTIEVKQKIW